MKNKTFGSVFIVAGTAIGAGMLAMPIAAAGNGFFVSLAILVGLWAVMCYTSLLLVEIYQHESPALGLGSIAEKYLGFMGKAITGFSMMFLMYALIAAYISGAGETLVSVIKTNFDISVEMNIGIILFTLIGGGVICFGTASVDSINRILFGAKIIFLVLLLMLLFPHVEAQNLMSQPVKPIFILSAIPVVFTSFGFHGSVPSIVKYMKGDIKKLRLIFIIGSAIPLMTYILWQIATLGSIQTNTFLDIIAENSGLQSLLKTLQDIAHSDRITFVANMFMSLALATSFLGVALGLFDYLADLFKRNDSMNQRLQTGLLTFLPPLLFALFYPAGFIMALGYAAMALAILALIIPSLLIYRSRKLYPNAFYRVKGGNFILPLIFLLGVMIIIIQFGIAFRLIPNIS